MPTRQELLQEAYNRGLLDPNTAALVEQAQARNLFEAEEEPSALDSLTTFGSNLWAGLFDPVTGVAKSSALLTTEEDARQTDWWKNIEAAQQFLGAEGDRGTFWTETAPRAIGQIGTYGGIGAAAGSFAGPGGTAVGALLGVIAGGLIGFGQSVAEIYEDAKNHGADEETAREAAKLAGTLSGLLESIPWIRNVKSAGGLFKEVTKTAGKEAVQEGTQTVTENVIAKSYYDQGRDILGGVTEATGAGGIAGAVGELVFGGRRNRYSKVDNAPEPLPSERTGLSGTVQNTMDMVSNAFGRKSVSVLNKYQDLSPEAATLRNEIEHFEKFEGPEGMVKGPDWYETKQTNMGDLYSPVENSLERIRDSWGGRKMSKGLQEKLLKAINGTSKISLNKSQMEAYNQLKAGNEGPAKMLSSKDRRDVDLAYAANTIKNSVAETDYRLEKAGVQKGYSREGNIPFFFNRKAIRKNMGSFSNWLVSKGYADDQAHGRRISQGILSNGGVAFLNDPDLKGEKANVNKPINTKEVPTQFRETNIENALPKYTLRAANRIAYANVFGGDGSKLNTRIEKIKEELGAQGKIMEQGDEQQLRDLSDAMLNRYNPIYNEVASNVNRGLASFEAISTLGGATLSSVQEPFIMIERMGLTPFVQSLPAALNTVARNMLRNVNRHLISTSGSTKVAENIGVALDAANTEVLSSAFTGDYSGIQDAFFKSPFGLFLHQWTTFNRIWATNVGMKVLDSWADQAAQGKFKESQYKDLGLTVDDMQAIALLKQRTGMTLEQMLVANATNPNPQVEAILGVVLPSGRTLKDAIRPALVRMVNESVIAPRATNRPMWMNDPHLTALSLLKSFPIVFGNTVAKRMGKKIDPRNLRNMTPCEFKDLFVGAAALLGAAYAMVAVKDAVKGKNVEDRPWVSNASRFSEVMDSRLGQAINTMGILGPLSFFTDTMRYGAGGFLGPAASDISGMFKNLQEFAENKIGLADLAGTIGQRTAEALGSLGKSKDVQKAVGDYLYNLVDEF